MIEHQQQLPENIALCPMAEEAFHPLGEKVSQLINIIADIDQLLSGKRQQTLFVSTNFKMDFKSLKGIYLLNPLCYPPEVSRLQIKSLKSIKLPFLL